MVGLHHRTTRTYYYSVITLMVFQIIVVRVGICQIHIPFFRQQQLLASVFIDHIPAVVRCGGRTVYHMHRAELSSASCVQVGDGTSITERNYLWQR